MQFLVIHGQIPPPPPTDVRNVLCKLLCTWSRSTCHVNCANPSLTPPIVPTYRFLLKYTSRDEVAVLAKGSGGTVDMRNNIAQYDETSPLFGLLRYRRRNVLIKYLPEGCSRLIQGMSQSYHCFVALAWALSVFWTPAPCLWGSLLGRAC